AAGAIIPGVFLCGWARKASDGLVGVAKRDGEWCSEVVLRYLADKAPLTAEEIAHKLKRLEALVKSRQPDLVQVDDLLALSEMPAWPSNDTMAPSALLTSLTSTCASWGMTIGRLVRVWGLMGERISACTAGLRMGPPAAMEYAVEPVGVEMMSPSPRNPVTNWPSMEI